MATLQQILEILIQADTSGASQVESSLKNLNQTTQQSTNALNQHADAAQKAGQGQTQFERAAAAARGELQQQGPVLQTLGQALAGLGPAGQTAIVALGGVAAGFAAFEAGKVAIAGLTATIGDWIHEAERSQQVQTQTAAVLRSTGEAAGVSQQGVTKLADAYSRLTPFEDETIQQAENLLLTFTNIGAGVFPQATEAVLNMATALGEDTSSAAIQLGKALQEPITGAQALRRVGVQLNDAQQAQIKSFIETGDVASAQGVILQELEKEFGGLARAEGETAAGATARLNTQLGNVKEQLGGLLLPAVVTVATNVLDLAESFQSLITGAEHLTQTVSHLPGPLAEIAKFEGNVAQAFLQANPATAAATALLTEHGNKTNDVAKANRDAAEAQSLFNQKTSEYRAPINELERHLAGIKQTSEQETAAAELAEKANDARAKGDEAAAQKFEEANHLIQQGLKDQGTEAEKAAERMIAADDKKAQAAKTAASDIHQASMLILDGKTIEASGYQLAAKAAQDGNDVLAQSFITAAQEQQKAADIQAANLQKATDLESQANEERIKGHAAVAAQLDAEAQAYRANDRAAQQTAATGVTIAKQQDEIRAATEAAAATQAKAAADVVASEAQVDEAYRKHAELMAGQVVQGDRLVTEETIRQDQERVDSAKRAADSAFQIWQAYVQAILSLQRQLAQVTLAPQLPATTGAGAAIPRSMMDVGAAGAAGGGLSPSANIQAVIAWAQAHGIDPRLPLTVLAGETGGTAASNLVGDQGTSYGPIQIHLPAHPSMTQASAQNINAALAEMGGRWMSAFGGVSYERFLSNPEHYYDAAQGGDPATVARNLAQAGNYQQLVQQWVQAYQQGATEMLGAQQQFGQQFTANQTDMLGTATTALEQYGASATRTSQETVQSQIAALSPLASGYGAVYQTLVAQVGQAEQQLERDSQTLQQAYAAEAAARRKSVDDQIAALTTLASHFSTVAGLATVPGGAGLSQLGDLNALQQHAQEIYAQIGVLNDVLTQRLTDNQRKAYEQVRTDLQGELATTQQVYQQEASAASGLATGREGIRQAEFAKFKANLDAETDYTVASTQHQLDAWIQNTQAQITSDQQRAQSGVQVATIRAQTLELEASRETDAAAAARDRLQAVGLQSAAQFQVAAAAQTAAIREQEIATVTQLTQELEAQQTAQIAAKRDIALAEADIEEQRANIQVATAEAEIALLAQVVGAHESANTQIIASDVATAQNALAVQAAADQGVATAATQAGGGIVDAMGGAYQTVAQVSTISAGVQIGNIQDVLNAAVDAAQQQIAADEATIQAGTQALATTAQSANDIQNQIAQAHQTAAGAIQSAGDSAAASADVMNAKLDQSRAALVSAGNATHGLTSGLAAATERAAALAAQVAKVPALIGQAADALAKGQVAGVNPAGAMGGFPDVSGAIGDIAAKYGGQPLQPALGVGTILAIAQGRLGIQYLGQAVYDLQQTFPGAGYTQENIWQKLGITPYWATGATHYQHGGILPEDVVAFGREHGGVYTLERGEAIVPPGGLERALPQIHIYLDGAEATHWISARVQRATNAAAAAVGAW